MAIGINRVLLVGNLTRDPELRQTAGGTAVCTMRIAVNGREKVGGQWRDRADYFDIQVYGNQADACAQYLHRGSPVGVDGRLRLDQWEKDGQKHSRVLVNADGVQFLPDGRPRDGGGGRSDFQAPSGADFDVPDATFTAGAGTDFQTSDDIPF